MSVSAVPLKQRNRAYPIEIASNPSRPLQWELNHRPTWSYEWLVLRMTTVQTQVNGNLHQVWGECLCHWRVEQLIHISWRISGDKYIHQWNFMKSKQSNSPYVQYWPTSKCNLVGWVYRHHEVSWPMATIFLTESEVTHFWNNEPTISPPVMISVHERKSQWGYHPCKAKYHSLYVRLEY